MENKALPPAKIDPKKLLPGKGTSAIVKKISSRSVEKSSDGLSVSNLELGIIKKQVIRVRDLISTSALLEKEEEKRKRKNQEQKRFKEKEEKLEKPKEEGKEKIKLPSAPKLSFLDRIKKFLFNILLGFIVVKLIPQAPKLIQVAKLAGQALDFITDWGGKLLNGLVTFIDWGYKAYDGTRKFLSNLGGENFAKVFDTFNGVVGKVIEAAITTAIVLGSQGDDGVLDIGMDMLKDRFLGKGAQQAAQTGAQAAGQVGKTAGMGAGAVAGIVAGAGLLASALGEGAFQVRKFAIKPIQNLEKAYKDDKNPFTKFGRGVVLNMVRPLYGLFSAVGFLLDVVGAPFRYAIELLRFPFLSEEDKKKQASNLSKFDARIREDLRKALNMLTLGLAFKEKGSFGNIYGNKGTQKEMMSKMAGGGITRAGRKVGGPARRKIKKSKVKREIRIEPTELKPGANVGGDKKIQKIFPKSESTDTVNPLGYTETFYDKTSEIPFFGPIFGLATKSLVGQKPSRVDYENVGKGLNSWMDNTFSRDILRTGGAFAGGGEVNSEMFMKGEDLSRIIAKSVEDNISSRLDNTMNELMKQLMLKDIDRGKEPGQTTPGAEEEPSGSPTLTGNSNAEKVFRYLTDKEGFTPEAAAGIIGNLMQESGVNPKSRQLGGGPGRGIMQWTESERWASLSAWANNSGKDPWALETQVEWMVKEMKSYGTYNRIKSVTSYKKAVEIFEREMERAGTPNYPRRYKYAADALASFGGKAGGPGIQLGKGYGSEGSKIAGELGKFIKSQLRSPAQFQAVTEHPEHGGVRGRHASGSYHYSNRAIDIGAYTHEQGPILNVIAQFNKMKGVKPVELLHGGNDSGHRDHVHVAYGKGGLVRGFTKAILGERGIEFVLDTDTTSALEQNFPGFLSELNKANYDGAIQVLRNYASYESGASMEVVVDQPEPEVVYVPMPISRQSMISPTSNSGFDSSYDYSYKNG
jgi:hypothetical protein